MATANLDFAGRLALFRMNSDQFSALPPCEPFRLELLDGRVLMAARPSTDHQYFAMKLANVLTAWVEDQGLGVVLPEIELRLDKEWTPVPDLVFVAREHSDRVLPRWVEGPADLVVEILSPSDEAADRETKFEAYARFGIPAYWIVDLRQRLLYEYQLDSAVYTQLGVRPFDQSFTPSTFSGLTIDWNRCNFVHLRQDTPNISAYQRPHEDPAGQPPRLLCRREHGH